ncbi:MAG TPA: pyrroline-5-carboxylate reductase [Xanthobacteraceae bacterium]|jgi:pyrroline-5-carboxylate reductase|nr:pyrroline-5-carboxylate reductase [Xanthobacteraceae bacterium]
MTEATNARNISLADFTGTLVLVGAGKMGGAMLEGWCALGLDPRQVVVLDPQPGASVSALAKRGVRLNPEKQTVPDASVIVLAVKPQVAGDVVPGVSALVTPSTVVLSIMAGKTLKSIEQALPGGTAVIRTMPNTPAAIGRGMTVGVPNARVTPKQQELVHRLMAATGEVEWVADEGLLDAVTAVSGSGPAYVFLLAEYLAQAGAKAGLPRDLAERLARATVSGAGELMHRTTIEAAILRKNVTSPGGTTAAALDVLMGEGGLDPLMERAVAAATRRSRELAG